jgi:hypothetical protein
VALLIKQEDKEGNNDNDSDVEIKEEEELLWSKVKPRRKKFDIFKDNLNTSLMVDPTALELAEVKEDDEEENNIKKRLKSSGKDQDNCSSIGELSEPADEMSDTERQKIMEHKKKWKIMEKKKTVVKDSKELNNIALNRNSMRNLR